MTSGILKSLGFKENGVNGYCHEELEHKIFLDEINEASDIVKFIYKEGVFEGEHQTKKRCSSIIGQITGDILENIIEKKQGAERLEEMKDGINIINIRNEEN